MPDERDDTRLRLQRLSHTLTARFGDVLDAAPDAMVLVDGDGGTAFANRMVERWFGYTRRELLGEPVELLMPGRFRSAHRRHRNAYAAHPQTRAMGTGLQLFGRRKDGSEFPVDISLSPLDLDGTRLTIAAIRDVTARRQAEAALRRANEELESFTHSVSHDLRAPIRQVEGFAGLLAEHAVARANPEASHLVDRITEAARHMNRLVDDLLVLARVGQQDLRPRETDLDAIVVRVIAELQPDLVHRTVEWRVGALPAARCDPGLIAVVFTNLIANAVKYTRARSPAIIEVSAHHEADGVHYVVRDNGVGFEMAHADRLFGVFQRLHDASEFEGTGVGLATVRRIVRRHGGDIRAEARAGQGATFTFTLGSCLPSPPVAPHVEWR